jgi:hypothetical protein
MSYKIEIELLMPDREACENLLKHLREVKHRDSDGESDEVKCELEELSSLIPISNPDGVVTSYSVTMIPEEEIECEKRQIDLTTTLELTIPSIEELRKDNIKIQEALEKLGTYQVDADENRPFEFSATSQIVFPCRENENVDDMFEEMTKKHLCICICEECFKTKASEELEYSMS